MPDIDLSFSGHALWRQEMLGRTVFLVLAVSAVAACKPAAESAAPAKPAPVVVQAPPPPPASRQIVADYMAALNARDAWRAGDFFASDAVFVDATMGAPQRGRQNIVDNVVKIFMNAVPDGRWEIRGEPVAEGDGIAFEWSYSGTNTGSWAFGVAPSNQKLNLHGVSFMRIKGGKIAYEGRYYDGVTMNKQMGW
jgi:steroid delta-isomerase-like uncharacterized protein